jgi:hypothetical protein
MSGGDNTSDTTSKKSLKNLKKGVDKQARVWYNKSVERARRQPLGSH